MKPSDYKTGMIGLGAVFGASLCCALPLALILLGLSSGGFMMYTMQFRWVLYPLGLLGVGTAWWLFWREKQRCDALVCKMTGGRINLMLVVSATALMGGVTYVDFFLVSM